MIECMALVDFSETTNTGISGNRVTMGDVSMHKWVWHIQIHISLIHTELSIYGMIQVSMENT